MTKKVPSAKEVADFCWEYKRNFFDHDYFRRRFLLNGWDFHTFRMISMMEGCWMESMEGFNEC